jgi:hypothetical protein
MTRLAPLVKSRAQLPAGHRCCPLLSPASCPRHASRAPLAYESFERRSKRRSASNPNASSWRVGHSCRSQRPRRAHRPRSTHRGRVRWRRHHPGRSHLALHRSSRRATGQRGSTGGASPGSCRSLQAASGAPPPPAGLVCHVQDRVPCDVHHCCLTFAHEGARLVGLADVLDLKASHGYSSSYARVVGIAEPLKPRRPGQRDRVGR